MIDNSTSGITIRQSTSSRIGMSIGIVTGFQAATTEAAIDDNKAKLSASISGSVALNMLATIRNVVNLHNGSTGKSRRTADKQTINANDSIG